MMMQGEGGGKGLVGRAKLTKGDHANKDPAGVDFEDR
jgi:hypothetical protein